MGLKRIFDLAKDEHKYQSEAGAKTFRSAVVAQLSRLGDQETHRLAEILVDAGIRDGVWEE